VLMQGSQVYLLLRHQYYCALEVSCTFVENWELTLAAQSMHSSLFEASYELTNRVCIIMKQIYIMCIARAHLLLETLESSTFCFYVLMKGGCQ
jgi:hypothetical protein